MERDIKTAIEEAYGVRVNPIISRPDNSLGDFSSNIALQLAKSLKKPPIEIAEEIASALRYTNKYDEVNIAGPGFINIRLSTASLLQSASRFQETKRGGQNIVLEYSCPNAFKELHTGHLYQTIFGDILGNLFAADGATIHRTSFSGDVGLHVAKCLWGIVDALGGLYPTKLSEIPNDIFDRSHWVSSRYAEGASAYESDETARQQIDEFNEKIYEIHDTHDRESPLAKIYWDTRQWSYDYFNAFYKLIDVSPMHFYPESATTPTGMRVVCEQLKKGVLKQSEGAVVFEGDTLKGLHTRVFITSKGLPTYETKDIGVIWQEQADYNFDSRVLITGSDQKEYMRVVFAAAETFRPELASRMTHLTNGIVRFGDGSKMSSRLGNVTRATQVIDEVRSKVTTLLDTPDEELVTEVTLGAIKYMFAKYKFGGDIAFDINDTVSLQGNSGPYIQYAFARAMSILKKSTLNIQPLSNVYDEDRALILKFGEYHEVIELAGKRLEPHHICNYLFELAQEFNRYYEKNRIVGSAQEAHRLSIVDKYASILKSGLSVLGIHAPDEI